MMTIYLINNYFHLIQKLEYSGTIRLIEFYKAVFPGWLNYI